MKRVAAGVTAVVAGICVAWMLMQALPGTVSDAAGYLIVAGLCAVAGFAIGSRIPGRAWPYCLALLLVAPLAGLYGLAAFTGDMVGTPPATGALLRIGSATFVPGCTLLGVWAARMLARA